MSDFGRKNKKNEIYSICFYFPVIQSELGKPTQCFWAGAKIQVRVVDCPDMPHHVCAVFCKTFSDDLRSHKELLLREVGMGFCG